MVIHFYFFIKMLTALVYQRIILKYCTNSTKKRRLMKTFNQAIHHSTVYDLMAKE